jgi:hypothetical protein
LYTNSYKGLKRGFELFDPDTANEKILILLSDGKMDLGDAGMEESLTANMINSLLPEMTKARIKVYTIAFTEQSDRLLLEKIAEKTGGFFTLANADRDLHVVFSSLFEKIKSPDSLPLQGGGFSVDKDVQELTLLVTKKSPSASITISSPSAKRFSAKDHAPDMSWFESTLFEMITMKQPMPGQWSAHLSSEEGNKIFVITNLRLRSSFNVNFVAQGTTLNVDAWLEKDGNHLRARDILRHVRISARLETPEGKPITLALHNGEDSVDGVYRSQFRADQPGDYSIRLTAEAATFKREKEFFFRTARASPPQSPAHSSLPGVTQRQIQDRKASFSWAVVLLKFAIINMALAFLITGGHYAKRYLAKVRGHSNAAH